jgi:F420-non-reducing hydrogenase iron-sulfur subunit
VFIAADGTDCPFLSDCTMRTAKIVDIAQKLLKENNLNPQRVRMAAICSVCADAYVKHMKNFFESLKKLKSAQEAN